MPSIPRFQLTHGQVAWSICHGLPPDRRTLDALRYLRQLGVPFTEEERGVGRGNRLVYQYDHLIECSVAIYAFRRGMKPTPIAEYLTSERAMLRKLYRATFQNSPEGAINEPWVKSRGKIRVTQGGEPNFLRLHPRFADNSGKIEIMGLEDAITYQASLMDLIERYPDAVYPLVPLDRVVLETVAWALVAPVTPPGRAPASKVPDN